VEIAPSILSAGHTFIAGTIDNVTRLRAELVRRGLASVEIEVDGGVGPENIRLPDTPHTTMGSRDHPRAS